MIYHVTTGSGGYVIHLETDDHHNELKRIMQNMQLQPLTIKGLFAKPNYGQVYDVRTKAHLSFRHDHPWKRESPWSSGPSLEGCEIKTLKRKLEINRKRTDKKILWLSRLLITAVGVVIVQLLT